MFKLLLVDDEEIICNSIASLIDWSSIEISLIGTCLDGTDAYHMILDESPDIVMTDIRMPGLSGLDLIEQISHTDLHTQFIILSGYEEFEYAKRAMRYGVRHYLLKPCDEKQIIECICDAIKDRKKALQLEELHHTRNQLLKDQHQLLIQNIIREGISLPVLQDSFFNSYEHYINLHSTPPINFAACIIWSRKIWKNAFPKLISTLQRTSLN